MSSEFYAATAAAFEKVAAKVANLEEWDDVLLAKITKLETRDAMKSAAIVALHEAGHPSPSDAEVEHVVDEFLQRRYTARRKASASSAPSIDWSKGGTLFIGNKAFAWDPATQTSKLLPDADPPAESPDDATRDPDARIAAHARHLRNLDGRLKQLERGSSSGDAR